MGTIRKGEMKMKSKFIILLASVLAVSTIGLAGCASDGNATTTTDTNSAEVNNGPYQDLKQETFETIYSQLYTEYATTGFESKIIHEKRTDYRLSFTGKNKETPLQVDVFKAMTNQRAITIQISSPQDNQPDSTMIDTMIQSLKF